MNFFKTLIASTLGVLLAFIIGFLLIIAVIVGTSRKEEPSVNKNSVLQISLSGSLPGQQSTNPVDELFHPDVNNKVSLQTLKENLTKAKAQDEIKGIWLNVGAMSEGWANLEEAHQLIQAFRDSSAKFIYASTGDAGFNEKGYYLATAADSIFAPPESFFEFDGFYSKVTFFKGALKKLGVEPEIIRHGKYKSAVEPFFRKNLSNANEYQLNQILQQVDKTFLSAVSKHSGKSVSELNTMLNEKPHLTTQFGAKTGLIDSLMYQDQVKDYIKHRIYNNDDEDPLHTISSSKYADVSFSSAGVDAPSTSNKIADIYASGPIMPESAVSSSFGGQHYITPSFFEKQLDKIKDDGDVKALVIRLNSPGGSGSTSDTIWRMIKNTADDMPVIVSMGDVAASGGYYIAAAADTIVAEPTTITGSIGVFATKFNSKELFDDKLGITFDEVKTNKHADWLSATGSFSDSERKAMQQFINDFYHTFLSRVAAGRGMDVAEVDSIAQGRVWIGTDAKKQGLVDVMGGLGKAVAVAAHSAHIKNYKLERFPKEKSIYDLLMQRANAKVYSMMKFSLFSGKATEDLRQQLPIIKSKGALTFFPYHITVN